MSATLDKIKEEMRSLPPEELQEVRELADSLLPESTPPAEPLDSTSEAAPAGRAQP